MTNMASVNRIRRRSSGTWKMVRSFSSMIRSGLRVRGDHFAAGRFDGLARGAARGVHLDGERHLEVATREQLDGTLPAHETLRLEPRRVDGRARGCAREPPHLHDVVFHARRVREPALREAALDRHLATFEPHRDSAARAGLLALVALAGRTTLAAGCTLAEALRLLHRAGGGMDVPESHDVNSPRPSPGGGP